MAAPRHPRPDARQVALSLLCALEQGRTTLDRLMDATLTTHAHLDRRDRALVFALTYGVQRWRRRLDWVAAHFTARSLARTDPKVRNILRLALFQILYLSRVPPSAAVHTAVKMAKSEAHWAAGFVNAVLRSALRQNLQVPLPDARTDPVAALATELAFPDWIVARWMARKGEAVARARCEAASRIPPLTMRANTLRTDRCRLMNDWQARGLTVRPTPVAPQGIVIEGFQGTISELYGYEQGFFQVQDEAAQLVGLLLAPAPGQRILDACAGLGGKTGHLAALCDDRAYVLATDQDDTKLADLAIEMRRLGVTGVETGTVDWTDGSVPGLGSPFDLILVDAPCSGLGVLGRNPDAKWHRQPADLIRCARRQQDLLRHLADWLKPGGALVYAVCSTEPEETVQVTESFVCRRSDFTVGPLPDSLPDAARALIARDGAIVTDPGRDGMDGFYMVRLERRG